jgi:cytochrome c oxidase subunit 2
MNRLNLVLANALAPERGAGWGLPRDVSSEGWRIDRLIQITTWLVLAVGIIGTIWLVWTLVAHSRAGRRADFFRGESKKAIAIPLGISAALFAVIDGNLFITSTSDLGTLLDVSSAERDPAAVRIELNAHQWAWDARYAGADGRFATDDDVVTLGDLRIPIDRPIIVQAGSVDVIHALYLPHLRVKQDIIPGRLTTLWFKAEHTGTFEIACAQHCGVNHYKMRGELTVMESAAFDRWVADMSNDSLRIQQEDKRSLEEESSRRPKTSQWPRWERESFGRNWGWQWEAAE